MTRIGKLQRLEASPLATTVPGTALPTLPARQGLWVGGGVLAAAAVAGLGVWAAAPGVGLSIALGAGAGLVNPKRLWAVPLTTIATGLVGALCVAYGLPAVLGAGAVAGALATALLPQKTDWLDAVNGALATLTGASLGLWAAVALIPSSVPLAISAVATMAVVSFMAAQGLLPAAIRFDSGPNLPSPRQIKSQLKLRYRPPVFRSLELFESARQHAPDRDTRRGLAEVAMWVFRLQQTRQTLDGESESIDAASIQERIERYESPDADADDFTLERRAATAAHLRRLLTHRDAIEREIRRTEALVDYALAFLEEARAGLAVARELPGETMPDRLDEVLTRLRNHADEGDARREAAREVSSAWT